MEAYFQTLTKTSGASDFLIVRDDAALTASPYRRKTIGPNHRVPSACSESSASNPCIGPPRLPRRKRSNDDFFSNCKATATRSQEKVAKARVLKSFFDEVMGPVAEATDNLSGDHINDAVIITTTSLSLARQAIKQSR